MKRILLAETAGFCFGVDRAVKMVEQLLESSERVYTLGPIIHNPQLVKELEQKGATIAGVGKRRTQGRYAGDKLARRAGVGIY